MPPKSSPTLTHKRHSPTPITQPSEPSLVPLKKPSKSQGLKVDVPTSPFLKPHNSADTRDDASYQPSPLCVNGGITTTHSPFTTTTTSSSRNHQQQFNQPHRRGVTPSSTVSTSTTPWNKQQGNSAKYSPQHEALFPLRSAQEVAMFGLWGLLLTGFALVMLLADVFQSYRPVFPFFPLIITAYTCVYCSVAALSRLSAMRYTDRYFSLFQPFVGGDTYVAIQCLGHLAIAASLMGTSLLWELIISPHTTYPHGPLTRQTIDSEGNQVTFYVQEVNRYGVLSICGALGALGSVLLMTSISRYQRPTTSYTTSSSNTATPLVSRTTSTLAKKGGGASTTSPPSGLGSRSGGTPTSSTMKSFTGLLRKSPLREMVLIALLSLGGSVLAALVALDPVSLAQSYGTVFVGLHIGCGVGIVAVLGVGKVSLSIAMSRLFKQFLNPFRGSFKMVAAKAICWTAFAVVIIVAILLRSAVQVLDPANRLVYPSSADLSKENVDSLLQLCGSLYVAVGCVSFVCILGLMAILFLEGRGIFDKKAKGLSMYSATTPLTPGTYASFSDGGDDVVVRLSNALTTGLQCSLGLIVVLLTAVNSQLLHVVADNVLLPGGAGVEAYLRNLSSVVLEVLGNPQIHLLMGDNSSMFSGSGVGHLLFSDYWPLAAANITSGSLFSDAVSAIQSSGVTEAMLTIQALFAAAMLASPPLTHFVGSIIHARSDYDLWQPFHGPRSFIVFQAIGWFLYSVGFLAGLSFLTASSSSSESTTSSPAESERPIAISILALSLVLSQICIHISVKLYSLPPSSTTTEGEEDTLNGSSSNKKNKNKKGISCNTSAIKGAVNGDNMDSLAATFGSSTNGNFQQHCSPLLPNMSYGTTDSSQRQPTCSLLRSQCAITASVLVVSSMVPRIVCDIPWIFNHPTLSPLLLIVATALWGVSILTAQLSGRGRCNLKKLDSRRRFMSASASDENMNNVNFWEGLSLQFTSAAFQGTGEYVALQAVGWTLAGIYILLEVSALAPLLASSTSSPSTIAQQDHISLKAVIGGSIFPNVMSSLLSLVPFVMIMASQVIQSRHEQLAQAEETSRSEEETNGQYIENRVLMMAENNASLINSTTYSSTTSSSESPSNYSRNRLDNKIPSGADIKMMENILMTTMSNNPSMPTNSPVLTHLAFTIRHMRSLRRDAAALENDVNASNSFSSSRRLSRVYRQKVNKLYSVSAVFAFTLSLSTLVLYILASQASLQPGRKPVALVLGVAAWIGTTFSVAVIHAAFGRACNGADYKPFMPFHGGGAFVVLQACGWGAYGACSLLVALFCMEVSVTVGALISAGVLSASSQFFVFMSITRFTPSDDITNNGESVSASYGMGSILEEHAEGAVSILLFLSAFTLSHCYETLGFGTLGALPVFVSLTSICLALPLALIALRKTRARSSHHKKRNIKGRSSSINTGHGDNIDETNSNDPTLLEFFDVDINDTLSSDGKKNRVKTTTLLELPKSHTIAAKNMLIGVETMLLIVGASLPLLILYYMYFRLHSFGAGLLMTFASGQTVMIWTAVFLAATIVLSSTETVSSGLARFVAFTYFSLPAIFSAFAFLPMVLWPTAGTISLAMSFLCIAFLPTTLRKFVYVPVLFMVTGVTWYNRCSQLFWYAHSNYEYLPKFPTFNVSLSAIGESVAFGAGPGSDGGSREGSVSSGLADQDAASVAEWLLLAWFTLNYCVLTTQTVFMSLLRNPEFIHGILDLVFTAGCSWYTTTVRGAPDIDGSRRLPWLLDMLEAHINSYMQRYFSARIIRDDVAAMEASIVENDSSDSIIKKDTGVFPPAILGFHPHGVFPITAQWTLHSDLWRSVALGTDWGKWKTAREAVRREEEDNSVPEKDAHKSWEERVSDRLPELNLSSTILKGMTTHGATIIFKAPLLRDVGMALGMRNVCRRAIETSIEQGYSPLIVTGGQSEMIYSRISDKELHIVTYHVGFARLALEYKRPLIPILSLGEHNIMGNIYWPRVQSWFLKRVGFGFPVLPIGWLGLPLPRKVPLTVVVGSPVFPDPAMSDHTNSAHVEALAALYFHQLRRLFYRHRVDSGFAEMDLIYHSDKRDPKKGVSQTDLPLRLPTPSPPPGGSPPMKAVVPSTAATTAKEGPPSSPSYATTKKKRKH